MRDPREAQDDVYLTEDSDDALADLEKEFELKKQKLIAERARIKQESKNRPQVNVERSPSPQRKKLRADYFQQRVQVKPEPVGDQEVRGRLGEQGTHGIFRVKPMPKPEAPKSEFASRLLAMKTEQGPKGDLSERIFEFENVPEVLPFDTMPGEYDEFTGIELKSRRLPHNILLDLLHPIKVLGITKLLAKVVAPKFEEPNYVNWCFVGMIVYKGQPKQALNGHKFLQLKVGDFVHTVDVMLFGSAFERFWKLQLGEIVVILNPRVKKFQGKFNMSVAEDLQSIVEIGSARHFGYCESTNKNATRCKHVVDLSQTKLCSYHEEEKYRAQASRMELQGSVKLKDPRSTRRGAKRDKYYKKGQREWVDWKDLPGYQLFEPSGTELNPVYKGSQGFDEKKFDRPVANAQKERLKEASNARLRLEEQLRATVAPARAKQLQTLGILSSSKKEGNNFHKTTSGVAAACRRPDAGSVECTAVNDSPSGESGSTTKVGQQSLRKLINGMGFDPTGAEATKPASNGVWVQELQQLSRQKKVSLAPSREDRRRQATKWRNTTKELRAHAGGAEEVSDDELEISFASEKDKIAYKSLAQ